MTGIPAMAFYLPKRVTQAILKVVIQNFNVLSDNAKDILFRLADIFDNQVLLDMIAGISFNFDRLPLDAKMVLFKLVDKYSVGPIARIIIQIFNDLPENRALELLLKLVSKASKSMTD
jgi:hypothetical protein